MAKEEYKIRCRCCGQLSPVGVQICKNPNCKADLLLLGDYVREGESQVREEKPKPKPEPKPVPKPEPKPEEKKKEKPLKEKNVKEKPVKQKKVKEPKPVSLDGQTKSRKRILYWVYLIAYTFLVGLGIAAVAEYGVDILVTLLWAGFTLLARTLLSKKSGIIQHKFSRFLTWIIVGFLYVMFLAVAYEACC